MHRAPALLLELHVLADVVVSLLGPAGSGGPSLLPVLLAGFLETPDYLDVEIVFDGVFQRRVLLVVLEVDGGRRQLAEVAGDLEDGLLLGHVVRSAGVVVGRVALGGIVKGGAAVFVLSGAGGRVHFGQISDDGRRGTRLDSYVKGRSANGIRPRCHVRGQKIRDRSEDVHGRMKAGGVGQGRLGGEVVRRQELVLDGDLADLGGHERSESIPFLRGQYPRYAAAGIRLLRPAMLLLLLVIRFCRAALTAAPLT